MIINNRFNKNLKDYDETGSGSFESNLKYAILQKKI